MDKKKFKRILFDQSYNLVNRLISNWHLYKFIYKNCKNVRAYFLLDFSKGSEDTVFSHSEYLLTWNY